MNLKTNDSELSRVGNMDFGPLINVYPPPHEVSPSLEYIPGTVDALGLEESLSSAFASGFILEGVNVQAVNEFLIEGRTVRLRPALTFEFRQSPEDNAWEVHGHGLYESVFVHAPSLEDARKELREDVLPFLWRTFVLEEDDRLSREARNLKRDLRGRVVE